PRPSRFLPRLDGGGQDRRRPRMRAQDRARPQGPVHPRGLVDEIAPPEPVGHALLALPTLFGHAEVLERAAPFARNKRAERALAKLAEVYRLLTIYGLADAVLLDLGGVRGFDYYSGMYFEAYVAEFGAAIAAGGRYDHMVGRFGYDCPAVGFAFDIARALSVMETQGVDVALPGPDFFIIDFTPEKTAALSPPQATVVVGYQGGNNAGHTVVVGREKYVLHSIPSGILHAGCRCVIGCGVVVDPGSLIEEMESLVQRGVSFDGNLFISKNA